MALLEGRCAFEAAGKASDDDLRTLQRLHAELEHHAGAQDLDGYFRANHDFHSFVQGAGANRWLDRVTGDLRRFVRLMRGRQLALPGRIDMSIGEHRELLDAFMARDAARAERAMHDHLMAQLVALKKRSTFRNASTDQVGRSPVASSTSSLKSSSVTTSRGHSWCAARSGPRACRLALRQGGRADHVVGDDATGVAQRVGLTLDETEDLEPPDAGVHAGEDGYVE